MNANEHFNEIALEHREQLLKNGHIVMIRETDSSVVFQFGDNIYQTTPGAFFEISMKLHRMGIGGCIS